MVRVADRGRVRAKDMVRVRIRVALVHWLGGFG